MKRSTGIHQSNSQYDNIKKMIKHAWHNNPSLAMLHDKIAEKKRISPMDRPGEWNRAIRMKKRIAAGAPKRGVTMFEEGKNIALRRDDFWRWGTTSIKNISVLKAILNRMLPRRYHKWCPEAYYKHYWSVSNDTHELYITARVRTTTCNPSVLKFRLKEISDDPKIKIVIDYHRIHTDRQHRQAIWSARDAMCRLIVEMDDWYAEMKEKEISLIGEEQSYNKDMTLPSPGAELTAADRFPRRSGIDVETTGNEIWGDFQARAERGTYIKPEAIFDPRKWDLNPIRKPQWTIPRVEGSLAQHRHHTSTKDTHQ